MTRDTFHLCGQLIEKSHPGKKILYTFSPKITPPSPILPPKVKIIKNYFPLGGSF